MKQTEPAHFSGRLEHPTMYVFSVWGDDILYLLDSSLFILDTISRIKTRIVLWKAIPLKHMVVNAI